MKIVLVRPFNKFSYSITPPLGLGYLASILKIKGGHEVSLYEGARDKLSLIKSFYNFLLKTKPKIIGIQAYSVDLAIVKDYLQCAKEVDKKIVTVLGGHHPSALPRETMFCFRPNLDFIITGEAEKSLLFLANYIEKKNGSLNEIPGLVWCNEKEKIFENKKEFITDLDQLPWPDWELLNLPSYPHAPVGALSKFSPVVPILTSRGCPMGCNFCAAKTIYGNEE
jgi:radical SAM superfamily enzyme YgiQ (UPF0313 family)